MWINLSFKLIFLIFKHEIFVFFVFFFVSRHDDFVFFVFVFVSKNTNNSCFRVLVRVHDTNTKHGFFSCLIVWSWPRPEIWVMTVTRSWSTILLRFQNFYPLNNCLRREKSDNQKGQGLVVPSQSFLFFLWQFLMSFWKYKLVRPLNTFFF